LDEDECITAGGWLEANARACNALAVRCVASFAPAAGVCSFDTSCSKPDAAQAQLDSEVAAKDAHYVRKNSMKDNGSSSTCKLHTPAAAAARWLPDAAEMRYPGTPRGTSSPRDTQAGMQATAAAFSAEYDLQQCQQLQAQDAAVDSFRDGCSHDAALLRGAQLHSACCKGGHIAATLQQQQQPSAQDYSRSYSTHGSEHVAVHMQQAAGVTRQGSACLLRNDSSSSSYSAALQCMPDIARHSSADHNVMTMQMIDAELMQLMQVGGSPSNTMQTAYVRLNGDSL
jgi:hypothetical protein